VNVEKTCHCEERSDVGRIDLHFALYTMRCRASFAMTLCVCQVIYDVHYSYSLSAFLSFLALLVSLVDNFQTFQG
jgi:hypothetical protein